MYENSSALSNNTALMALFRYICTKHLDFRYKNKNPRDINQGNMAFIMIV